MTRAEAHRLLDALRAGADLSPNQVRCALIATGDIAVPWHVKPVPAPLQAPGAAALLPVASHLNRSTRVMRGASDVM